MSDQESTEHQNSADDSDFMDNEERERIKRFIRFAGVILIFVIGWYAFDLASF